MNDINTQATKNSREAKNNWDEPLIPKRIYDAANKIGFYDAKIDNPKGYAKEKRKVSPGEIFFEENDEADAIFHSIRGMLKFFTFRTEKARKQVTVESVLREVLTHDNRYLWFPEKSFQLDIDRELEQELEDKKNINNDDEINYRVFCHYEDEAAIEGSWKFQKSSKIVLAVVNLGCRSITDYHKMLKEITVNNLSTTVSGVFSDGKTWEFGWYSAKDDNFFTESSMILSSEGKVIRDFIFKWWNLLYGFDRERKQFPSIY